MVFSATFKAQMDDMCCAKANMHTILQTADKWMGINKLEIWPTRK